MFDKMQSRSTILGMNKARAFKRDAYLGLRMPDEDKRRLTEICRKRRRDVSSFALEFIVKGIAQVEAELQKQGVAN